MPCVSLIDGREVDSTSEEWRHECEARYIANIPTREQRHDYLAIVTKRRGPEAGQALARLAQQIYTAQRAALKEGHV
jgi:hypothetical protein